MVKHTQTIRKQKPMNCLSGFDHFVGWRTKGLHHQISKISKNSFYQRRTEKLSWPGSQLVDLYTGHSDLTAVWPEISFKSRGKNDEYIN